MKIDITKPLTEHIERYKSKYAKLLNLMKSSKDTFYSVDYHGVLAQDKAKKDLLLSALVPHNPLLVDNLMSNPGLSYEDVKNHLCTLPSNQFKEGFVDGFRNSNGGTAGGATATVKVDKAMITGVGELSSRRASTKRMTARNRRIMSQCS